MKRISLKEAYILHHSTCRLCKGDSELMDDGRRKCVSCGYPFRVHEPTEQDLQRFTAFISDGLGFAPNNTYVG